MLHQLIIIYLIAIIPLPALASEICDVKAQVADETLAVGKFIRSGGSKPELLKNKIYRIDANNKDFPELSVFASEGIVTANAAPDWRLIRNGNQGMGRAIPITRCHSLTNLHVVKGAYEEQGFALDSSGASVLTSYGQANACDGGNAFKVKNHRMRLVGYDKSALYFDAKKNKFVFFGDKDWAVLGSRVKLPSTIRIARVARSRIAVGEPAFRSGTPAMLLDDQGFSVSGVEYVIPDSTDPNGTKTFDSMQNGPGASGGGIYAITDQGLALAGVNTGQAVASQPLISLFITVHSILQQIKETHPALWDDIIRVANGGECSLLD